MALLKSPDAVSVETSLLRIPAGGLGCIATEIDEKFLSEASTFTQRGEVLVLFYIRLCV
jgi:hypothetical protein